MDVTALLNSSSAVVLQRRDSVGSSTPSATGDTTATSTAVPTPERSPPRRTSGSRSPNRNRTPWDAGGYSLPLTLDTKLIPTFTSSAGRPTLFPADHSPTEARLISSSSPKSPKHKFSDSRSSNSSSYTSCSSLSHSRISSLSTVSEFQPTSSSSTLLFTDVDCSSSNQPSKPAAATCHRRQPSLPASLDSTPGYRHRQRREEANEPSPKMDPYHQQPPRSSRQATNMVGDEESPSRPGSPSDALMIRRGQESSGIASAAAAANTAGGSYDNGMPEANNTTQAQLTGSELPLGPFQGDGGSYANNMHRRAASAPEGPYWAVVDENGDESNTPAAARDQLQPLVAPPADPSSLPRSLWPQGYQIMFPEVAALRDTLVRKLLKREAMRHETEQAIMRGDEFCMHPGPPCNLGGPKRKAISHLFGRNKKCTRLIPPPVWVHYCRKHYQRSRYRNHHDFSQKQAKLLMEMIHRIQVWSDLQQREMDRAEAEGRIPTGKVLVDWQLAMRKRETKRKGKKDEAVEQKPRTGEKRRRPHDEDGEQDEDYESDYESDDEADGDPNFDQDLAVTGWLKDSLRKGYSTTEILEIALRIRLEIKNGTRSKWPDVEILPNIFVRDDQIKPPNKLRKTTSATDKAHRRSKSTGIAMRSSQNANETRVKRRRVSQPTLGFGQPESSHLLPPVTDSQPSRNTARVVPVFPPYNSRAPYEFGTAQDGSAANNLTHRYDASYSGDLAKFEPRRYASHHQRSYSEASSHWRVAPQMAHNISDNPYAPSSSNTYGVYDSNVGSSGYNTSQRPGFGVYFGQGHAQSSMTNPYGAGGTNQHAPALPSLFPELPPSHFQPPISYGRPSTSTNNGPAYPGAAKHTRHLSTPITRPHDLSTPTPVSLAPLTNVSALTRASPSESLNRPPYHPTGAAGSGTDYFASGHFGSSNRSEYQPHPYNSQSYPNRNMWYGQGPSTHTSALPTHSQHGISYSNDHGASSAGADINGMTQAVQNSTTSYPSSVGYPNYAPRHQRVYSSGQVQINMPTVNEAEGGSNSRSDGSGNGSNNENVHGSGYENNYNDSH